MDEEIIVVLTEEEKKEMLNSVKLVNSEIESLVLNKDENIDTKTKPKTKVPKDKPTPKEIKTLNEKEAAKLSGDETQDLYDEFKSFLENKSDLKWDDSDNKQVIPTGIDLLDAILGGGFAIGALDIIVGAPGSGKSMLAMHAMANCQLLFDNPLVAYLDSEQSTTRTRLANLGVTHPKINPYNSINVEKVFQFLEGICLFKELKKTVHIPSLVVWDSIANTLSQKEIETDNINSVIGYKAKLLSLLVPKYVAKAAQYNICFLAVNQLRDVLDLGQFSAPRDLKFLSSTKEMPGGQTLKFNAFQLLEFKHGGVLDPEKYGISGVKAKVKAVKNKLFNPNIEVEILGDFSRGFSNFHTNYNFLANTERLTTGAWNYLKNYPTKKFRTKDALSEYNNDKGFHDAFDEAVNDALNNEIISKSNFE